MAALQKGLMKLGWNFKSTYLESEAGRKMIAYLIDKDAYKNEDLLKQREFKGDHLTTFTINKTNPEQTIKFSRIEKGENIYFSDTGKIYASVTANWRIMGTMLQINDLTFGGIGIVPKFFVRFVKNPI